MYTGAKSTLFAYRNQKARIESGMEIAGKVALVTGSGHRLGREIALGLAEQGCSLVIHFHHAEKEAAETVQKAKHFGVQALKIQADLRTIQGVETLFTGLDQAFGSLDILVNSAAILRPTELLDVEEMDWDQTLDLNLKGAFFCLQQAAKRMRIGAIVNISDVIGRRPWKRFPVHSISKAGLEMLTQVASLALAPDIRVNAIAPGLVLRPSTMDPARWEALSAKSPLQRSGTPKDIVEAVLFLLKNDYITGETLVVDGGMQWDKE